MKEIFLDAASNTPVDKRVFKAMKPYLKENFMGNSRSIHGFGIKASKIIEEQRNKIAKIFNVPSNNIVYTSGATESNNMVIKGLAYKEMTSGKPKKDQKRHIICSATEHDSVINACKQLAKLGFKIDYVYPEADGIIYLENVKKLITNKTLLICVMAINNELGVENDVYNITEYAYKEEIFTLVDCTQLLGYGGGSLQLRLLYPYASFFTFSGHKIYGPEGTGCLVATDNNLEELYGNGLVVGGAQEYGLRGGTMNVAGVVGISTAVQLIDSYIYKLPMHYEKLYFYLKELLLENFGSFPLNVEPDHKNIISLNFGSCFKGYVNSLAETLAIRGIAVSAGSACDSEHNESEGAFNPSHVLKALNLSDDDIRCTIRISFNRHTTLKDINRLVEELVDIRNTIVDIDNTMVDIDKGE